MPPEMVTVDWAEATPTTAKAAKAIRDFFIESSPKFERQTPGLKIPGRAPIRKLNRLHQSWSGKAKEWA
jgi:hypothetical protein